MKKNNVFLAALLLSIAIHAIFGAVLWTTSHFKFQKPREQATVELMDPAQIEALMKKYEAADLKGQIVEQDQRLNDEIDQNARFMSKHNQKVVQETQAALNGKFKNSADQGGAPKFEKKAGREEKAQTLTKNEEKTKEEKDLKRRGLLLSQTHSPGGACKKISASTFRRDAAAGGDRSGPDHETQNIAHG